MSIKNLKQKKWILSVIVVAALVGGSFVWRKQNEQASMAVQYERLTLDRGMIRRTVLASGVVQPKNRLEIKPPLSGRIEQVLVREGAAVRKGQILVWMSSTERATMLDAARAKGPEEVSKWEEYYRATPIVAPIDGQVIQRKVEAGQTIDSSSAILVLADKLSVKAKVDETDLAMVRLSQIADITLDAYPQDHLLGRVVHIAYDAQTVSNVTTYEIDVVPDAPPAYMRSGMSANVSLLVEQKDDVLRVPVAALMSENGIDQVRVVDLKTQAVQIKTVKLGMSDGKYSEVLDGLKGDETILGPQMQSLSEDPGQNPFQMRRKPKNK